MEASFYYSIYGLLTQTFNASSLSINSIIDLILSFAAGLLFGLAVKKALVGFLLAIIAFVVFAYVGLTFIPKISFSYEFHKWSLFLPSYMSSFKFGGIVVSITVILFLVGLAIGLWKG